MENFKLGPKTSVPKVEQIISSILLNIEKGIFIKDERLMSINQFSQKYGVARDTIEKAYQRLKKMGIIGSVKGKGYFVLENSETRLKILFIFNKLSSYKKIIYDAFVDTLGEKARVELYVHHYSPALLRECLTSNFGQFHYYVVMPHFFQIADESEYLEAFKIVPPDQLVLIDKQLRALNGVTKAVFQDFKMDIKEALESAALMFSNYSSITVIFPPHNNHPIEINEGVAEFCKAHNIGFAVVPHAAEITLTQGMVYIILTEADLAIVIMKARKSGLVPGTDIGIISFNETVFKELLDITVITTNFEQMGKSAANLILKNKDQLIKNPFKLIKRGSL